MTAAASPPARDPERHAAPGAHPHGRRSHPLRGRHVGILCGDLASLPAIALQRAVGELGARVALVRVGVGEAGDPGTLEPVAYVLSRLYDGVVCVDLSERTMRAFRDASGMPVISEAVPCAPASDEEVRDWVARQLAALLEALPA